MQTSCLDMARQERQRFGVPPLSIQSEVCGLLLFHSQEVAQRFPWFWHIDTVRGPAEQDINHFAAANAIKDMRLRCRRQRPFFGLMVSLGPKNGL
jgi:hypothetical protein